uniref:Uncharacterized protein n=1 Tax=Acrobeloides nanus TaxID=290746 RepID=A0A914D9C4_9BILA
MCICDIDGQCYKPYRYNTEVMFVPYCDETGCHVYAAVTMGKLCRGCDRNDIGLCWGCVEHDTTRDPVGSTSNYIKVDKVGCFDCISILHSKCPADDFSNVGLPGWPSVVNFKPTQTSLHFRTIDPRRYFTWTYATDSSNLISWTPYVIHPRILAREYATDAMRDILYECIWCKIWNYPGLAGPNDLGS